MNDQIMQFSEHFISPLLCGLRSGYSTQHAFLRFVKCKKSLDKKGFASVMFIDLARANT